MSEMSLLDTSGAERGKSSRTSPVAGQHTPLKMYKYTQVNAHTGVTPVLLAWV